MLQRVEPSRVQSFLPVLVTVLVAAMIVALPAPVLAVETCQGLEATITGTPGDDILEGTSGADVIVGLDGNDTITGLGGDDVICGDGGDDIIDAGGGNDIVSGGFGSDVIDGRRGDDELSGDAGADTIRGADGRDIIDGGGGDDILKGGVAPDVMSGGFGNDLVKGQGGTDILTGDAGDDTIRGGGGDDDIDGGDDNDTIFGQAGMDTIRGGSGDDTLFGGTEDDILSGGGGTDSATGEDGDDDCRAETETTCEEDLIDFEFDRFYINQAVPAADSDDAPADVIAPVVGRPGIVRVFFSANRTDSNYSPKVLLHWKSGGQTGVIELDGPATMRKAINDGNLSHTYNYAFPKSFLKKGMKFYVEVDPDNEYPEIKEGNNRYPASGWLDPGVTTVPRLDITFVPIRLDGGSAPTLNQTVAMGLLEDAIDVHPLAKIDIEIHSPIDYTTTGTFSDWTAMLAQVRDLAFSEGSNRAYAGIISYDPAGVGVAGIGYVNGSGFSTWPYSVSIPSPSTVAHELGHNLSLPHVACSGGEGNPDPNYPYPGGGIGTWGYEADTGDLKDPAIYKDLMTYCNNEWISDYNYQNVLEFRKSASGFDYVDVPAGADVVSFSGSIAGHDVPSARTDGVGIPGSAFSVTHASATRIPVAAGDHQMVGLDAAGNVVAAGSFATYVAEDTLQATEVRHFAFSMGVNRSDLARIVRWEVRDAFGLVGATDVG